MTAALMPVIDYHQQRNAVAAAAARRHGVPVHLAQAISFVENARGIPDARGKAGEVGIFQVMPDMHGASASELENPLRNADVAMQLLRSKYDSLGSWEKALRAYNGALNKPTAGDHYVNLVRNQLSRQIGRPAPSPISTAAREWYDRLALARRVLEDPRFSEADRQRTLKQFHDLPVPR